MRGVQRPHDGVQPRNARALLRHALLVQRERLLERVARQLLLPRVLARRHAHRQQQPQRAQRLARVPQVQPRGQQPLHQRGGRHLAGRRPLPARPQPLDQRQPRPAQRRQRVAQPARPPQQQLGARRVQQRKVGGHVVRVQRVQQPRHQHLLAGHVLVVHVVHGGGRLPAARALPALALARHVVHQRPDELEQHGNALHAADARAAVQHAAHDARGQVLVRARAQQAHQARVLAQAQARDHVVARDGQRQQRHQRLLRAHIAAQPAARRQRGVRRGQHLVDVVNVVGVHRGAKVHERHVHLHALRAPHARLRSQHRGDGGAEAVKRGHGGQAGQRARVRARVLGQAVHE
mmetsp:Transcript_27157/g.69110  ORF Transcript_27157/g.69110 Transcript_27157/m.69110 type:complete len:349 (+) Transcript_27157:913-1959(+)